MTDRELLELAAKAAGYENPIYGELSGDVPVVYVQSIGVWSPLTDDGDALRLAVKLGIEFYRGVSDEIVGAYAGYPNIKGRVSYCIEAWADHPDEYAATRRAIVRAAAEIGRSMA